MPTIPIRRRSILVLTAFALLVTASPAAAANSTITGNQWVVGKQCVGGTCDPLITPPLDLLIASLDTPAIRMQQSGGGFGAQTWDIGANEANFFVRDLTGGSRLPFRIRPGAPTSSIDIAADGEVSFITGLAPSGSIKTGVGVQQFTAPVELGAADGAAVLAALRPISFSRYRAPNDASNAPHLKPDLAAFRAAFGLGATDTELAPADTAATALLAVQALDARVSTIAGTPGPAGPPGPAGATGPAAQLASANKKIAALTAQNKKMQKSIAALQKQMKVALAKRR